MTRERPADERISAWLFEEAPDQLPDRVLQATFERTQPTRQRRSILWWRHLPMNRLTAGIAVGAAAVVVLVIGVALYPRPGPSVGGDSSPTPPASATPTLEPISVADQIAFERTVDGNTDIYLMNLDRTGLVRLTEDPAVDGAPSWSADGARILFTRGSADGRDVYVMDADGGNVSQLTHSTEGEDSAAFSPDGSEIVFLRYVDPTYFDIFVMAADGSNERRLWHKDGVFASGPKWSKNGMSIFFNEDETRGGNIDIVRLDLGTQALSRITDTPGDDSTFDISPDGTTIAFQSDRLPGGIFLMDVDGTNVRHLTGSWTEGYPLTWSPSGQHLAHALVGGFLWLVPTGGGEAFKWTEGGLGLDWRPQP